MFYRDTRTRVDEIESMSREIEKLRDRLKEKEKNEAKIQEYYETNMSKMK